MKVLLVGGGGREHAIATALVRSSRVDKLYCAPGNAGIARIAECVPIGVMEFDRLTAFAKEKDIDLTVISMDDPLCAGIADAFEAAGLRVFGTRKNAAIIEGSKAFSKEYPIVLKASGLALGKGVLICEDREQARAGIAELMVDKKFGAAGDKIVIEEFMTGREVSALAFVDGKHYKLMTSSQDHKRIGDGDTGLNTGGMGTFSPSPFYTEEVHRFCEEHIYQKTVDAMAAEGRPFTGVLYFGLMLTQDGPKVLEYNTRFGDPETQVVLPRMKTDIVDVMDACIDGTLDQIDLEFYDNAAVCVVLASGGYPQSYEKGKVITGLERFDNADGYYCFHAGTKFDDNGNVVTSGGRVLGVTAVGPTLKEARAAAYEAAGDFEGSKGGSV